MKTTLFAFAFFALLYGSLFVTANTFAEHAEFSGHTDLSTAVAIDATKPGDNYGVFLKGRYILIVTGLAPSEIMMRDGILVRTHTVMKRGGFLTIYTLATPKERALWHKYFS